MKKYYDPRWFQDIAKHAVAYYPGGEREAFAYLEPSELSIEIPVNIIPSLVAFLNENGYIRPTITPESRQEDLKIIHRLLDIQEKKIK